MGWFIWAIAALFYAYEFTQRVAPGVMIPEIMASLQLDASAMGSFSAYYFYAYGLLQIPAGMLIDRFGPRLWLSVAALLISVCSFSLAYADTLWFAKLIRFGIGAGSAFAFLGCIKIARSWLLDEQLPLVVGLTNFSGVMGALVGGLPLAICTLSMGWKNTFILLSVVGFFISMALMFFVRLPQQDAHASEKHRTPWYILKKILLHQRTWLVALYGGLLVAPIAGFVELWSIPFLMKAHEISRYEAASLNSLVFIGIAVGGPVFGFLYYRFKNLMWIARTGTLMALFLLSMILYWPDIPLCVLGPILCLYGFFTSNMLLCFALVGRYHSKKSNATAIGFTNMIIMSGGAIFQPIIGWLLDKGKNADGIFSINDYHLAFSVLPFCLLLAFFLTFLLSREFHD